MKRVVRLTWPEFWEFANVELRDNAHIYASKLYHFGLCVMQSVEGREELTNDDADVKT